MSGLQRLIGWMVTLQCYILLVILLLRGYHRRVPLFVLYVAGVSVSATVMGVWYSWETWMFYQVTVAALRFGLALELTYSIFGAFPAAASTARRVTLGILVVTALTLMSAAQGDVTYTRFNVEIVPRLATGAVWILTALAMLVLWYRLPLGRLQRAILLGYAPYLLVFTVAMNLLVSLGWHVRDWVGYVDTLSFLALIHYWCQVAWRTSPVPPEGPPPLAPLPDPAAGPRVVGP